MCKAHLPLVPEKNAKGTVPSKPGSCLHKCSHVSCLVIFWLPPSSSFSEEVMEAVALTICTLTYTKASQLSQHLLSRRHVISSEEIDFAKSYIFVACIGSVYLQIFLPNIKYIAIIPMHIKKENGKKKIHRGH